MASWGFHDGNIQDLLRRRYVQSRLDVNRSLQIHSSLIRRLSLEKALEGHQGCVNSIAWNSSGSRLISGSDDTKINIWSYPSGSLLHSIETGHCANIFCTKFVPETSDELIVSGAGDAEVRLFNTSLLNSDNSISPSALYHCHTRRVKKLAVEIGNPNVVWSASEDGTLRQHDFRVGTSCPPAGASHQECRNVLLDLRSGAKRSLADPPKQTLMLKTCDISASRPHLLLVGGSDAFARLYDRRMLSPLSTSQRKMPPPPCVNFFCPMHLSDREHSNLHLTHVTFSPDGEEVLLSYGGEHVYLMDVNQAGGNVIQYAPADVSKLTSFSPTVNRVEPASDVLWNSHCKKRSNVKLDKCKKLIQIAQKCLDEQKNYHYGIEACNEVLDGHGRDIGPILKHECLCIRAGLLLKRKWKSDVQMAIRDCYSARNLNSSCFESHHYMSEALSQLGLHKEALEFAHIAQVLAPNNSAAAERVESAKAELAAGEADKIVEGRDGASGSEPRGGRLVSLTDIIFPAEANSDASHDGPRSEREDSDYDEELELDFETSISGDDEHDGEPNALHGSINPRIHRRSDSARESEGANGSCGSPSSSSSHNDRLYQPEVAIDMKQRYVGHCNVGTDIKQASFLGQRGEYVASGSDDGRWFIWEKLTGRLIKMLDGDESVVNCVQCHPFDCAVATSGIDDTIKIWTPTASVPSTVSGESLGPVTGIDDTIKILTPTASVPSTVSGGSLGRVTDDVLVAMEGNERRLSSSREPFLGIEILERFRVHEFTEGNLHPFECAQS